ncbi:kinase domain protein (macronuclear) [Tetrahymena thermophila SB210]|uniref:Kinase domain protein n=1 Tax=Tetrahymena thermophila (strain SB210) TaxID=312017 RepID=Q23Q97_TETTS|nr:kinase domain protein [Tetrahymena thermophila SB210]EAR98687.2 kinase domain protein [Tetrahymena thermophila SB210]|eukprot:XP_001018932.2 kinase domain protein [Tetrahymena thermophila SB210]
MEKLMVLIILIQLKYQLIFKYLNQFQFDFSQKSKKSIKTIYKMGRQKKQILSNSKELEKSKETEQKSFIKQLDDNSYKDLKFNDLLKLESLGKGGFGEVAVYYDHKIQQALAVKQFENEQHYYEEKERNSNCNFLQDRSKYFAAMLNYSDERKVIFYELGDCTLLEINNHFIQQNYLTTQIFKSNEYSSVEKKHLKEEKKGLNKISIKKENKTMIAYQKWKEIDLIYITYCLLNGLYYMRQNKMFHGDISPDNIMIFQNRLKYIDLGSSHLNNNKFYLKQYKKQFVNFNIMKPKKNYTDNEISQNELYALGRTITHLCLYIQEEREDIIINRDLTLNSLRAKFDSFKTLLVQSQSLKDYPSLSKVLLKMQYPYDEDIQKIFQEIKQDNIQKKDVESKDQQQKNEEIVENAIKLTKQQTKRLSKKDSQKFDENSKEKKEKQGNTLNSKRNLKEVNKQNDKEMEKCEEILQNSKKKIKSETKNSEILKTNKQTSQSIEKSQMMTTVIFSEEQNKENVEEEQQQNESDSNKMKNDISQIIIEILDVLQSLLDNFVRDNDIKILPQQKKDPPYDFEIYSFIFEKSDLIQTACQEIRSQRLEKLLQNHPNPNKELSYLMQLDQKNWRREAAFQVIIDQLSSLSSEQKISKEVITQQVMNIVLHQQKQIILRQKTYNIECSDFIDEIIFVCIQHDLPVVQIECAFTFCLIWYFQESLQDFKHFYESFQSQLQKINKQELEQSQVKKFEYLDNLSNIFNSNIKNNDQLINQIHEAVLNQISTIKIV